MSRRQISALPPLIFVTFLIGLSGCSKSNDFGATDPASQSPNSNSVPASVPMPSELQFKKINQEFQQQQQQQGPLCPPRFKSEIYGNGQVTIQDQKGKP